MISCVKNKIIGVAIFFTTIVVSQIAYADVQPAGGDIYYNGSYYADSAFYWLSPGPFPGDDPGYEHDLRVRNTFFHGCTSFTSLPEGYDDCNTGSVLDPSGYSIWSAGSFEAGLINPYEVYMVWWNFDMIPPVGSPSTSVQLYAQAVDHTICPFDWNWCMAGAGVQTQVLPPNATFNFGGNPSGGWW